MREREGGRERGRERECVCVCVCACVRAHACVRACFGACVLLSSSIIMQRFALTKGLKHNYAGAAVPFLDKMDAKCVTVRAPEVITKEDPQPEVTELDDPLPRSGNRTLMRFFSTVQEGRQFYGFLAVLQQHKPPLRCCPDQTPLSGLNFFYIFICTGPVGVHVAHCLP